MTAWLLLAFGLGLLVGYAFGLLKLNTTLRDLTLTADRDRRERVKLRQQRRERKAAAREQRRELVAASVTRGRA